MAIHRINIVRLSDNQDIKVETEGYILLYLDGDQVKNIGVLDIKALAPLLMKLALDRMQKS